MSGTNSGALRDLASAGFIFIVEQRVGNLQGGFRSVAAIKRISPALFSALGLPVALRLERTKAQKRLAKRRGLVPAKTRLSQRPSRRASGLPSAT